MQYRRSNYDVTDQVKLTDPACVYEETRSILSDLCPESMFLPLHQAFHDMESMYRGNMPGYKSCDVPYHDLQHVMDVTLASARLIKGYEQQQKKADRLGPYRIIFGVILALFHDCGYIRRMDDKESFNGSEYTKSHITRGADFLEDYLPSIGLAKGVPLLTRLIHYTGYEITIEDIKVPDKKDRILGYLVGSADLLAQMADRCYLEKCRDRLYPEFVLGGMTTTTRDDGTEETIYNSPEDLLKKTPAFYQHMVRIRLDEKFQHVSDYVKNIFSGQNLYQEEIERNLGHLGVVIKERDFGMLRRTLLDTPESKAFKYQLVA